ncbi:unnamed protein product [Brassicogethes aeneus]|uniref:Uncharacterized protein n=1 Tax=Brassicogethes aeneus TaxID=1431903 RepID=A0A9P0AQX1_BRAAE|nr:unnamed protein product [Brassicogethes aeneus]
MAAFKFCVLLFVSFLMVASSRAATKKQVLELLSKVPKEERIAFLRYNLLKGYEYIKAAQNNKYSRISPTVSAAIYQYVTNEHVVAEKSKLRSLQNTVCFPSGCIDMDDPGIYPF